MATHQRILERLSLAAPGHLYFNSTIVTPSPHPASFIARSIKTIVFTNDAWDGGDEPGGKLRWRETDGADPTSAGAPFL
jgi:hypothetical protein